MLDDNSVRTAFHEFGGLDAAADLERFRTLEKPPEIPLSYAVKRASIETGSGTAWLQHFWKCVRGPGKLTASEFFYYGLYRDGMTDDMRRRFVGKNVQTKIHRACCDPAWFAVAHDKMLFDSVMHGAGIPSPQTLAIYDPAETRSHPRSISSLQALTAFLNKSDGYPIFAKPIDGMYSVGALALTDVRNGQAHVRGQGAVATSDLAEYMAKISRNGYVLQRMLMPAPGIADCFGGTLATVRFLITLGEGDSTIQSAVIKIPRIDSVADNYWRDGNLLGAVDLDKGCITRAVTGTGPTLRTIEKHPDTGCALIGITLDDWNAAKNICHRSAGQLPGLKTQSWDIALTRKGPVAVEVNWGGDLNLHQLAHGRGAFTPEFCEHLRVNGYKGALPGA